MGSSLSSILLPPSVNGSDQALPDKVNYPIYQQEPTKLCMICMEEKSPSDMFRGTTTSCTDHSYCTECTVRYVTSKVDENVARIKCPDVSCTQLMEPYKCRDVIPKDLFERWDKALCESLIMSWEKASGCFHISCRCGVQFCYSCGSSWVSVLHSCKVTCT